MDPSHTRSHPRRQHLYNRSPPIAPPQFPSTSDTSTAFAHTRSLKKSATFHSASSPPSEEHDPILNVPSIPQRSPTCPKSLEAILASGESRIAQIIGAVDRSLSGLKSFSSDSQETLVAEGIPVPRFMVNTDVVPPGHIDVDAGSPESHLQPRHPQVRQKHHRSDSGIGSSVSSSNSSKSGDHVDMKEVLVQNIDRNGVNISTTSVSEGLAQTGINGLTALGAGSVMGLQHALSEYACKQIQKHIILPIIRENKLKDFHPLVHGIPYRVARKEITCLRDLEKVLLWLAPKWSVSKAAFLNFCETSIQCIHTTVEFVNEHDQRRPADRPYTNGYFLDLVEQVRQYATMLSASRATMTTNSSSGEDVPASDERIDLVGGLGRTGRPAELIRIKEGRSILLRTGEDVSDETLSDYQRGVKRCVGEDSEEDVLRSMARRKASALPVVKDVQKCSDCEKVFKRPCDLTKHEKTHSRPWKCSDGGCKYHEYGFPTEKERDRHFGDKHSSTPSKFRCQYHPCPYESKRESNCKQHMEKAHGWVYVRSKNNGKASKKPQDGKTPPTPQISTPGSYIFDAPTPEFHDGQGYDGATRHYSTDSVVDSAVYPEKSGPFTDDHLTAFDETFEPFDTNYVWPEPNHEPRSGNMNAYANISHPLSWDAADATTSVPSSFEASLPPNDDEALFGSNFDWSNMDHDVTSMNIQLITPATSVNMRPHDVFPRNPSTSMEEPLNFQNPSFSPGAKGDAMLYSPYSMQDNEMSTDEGYDNFPRNVHKPTHDFSLFDSSNGSSTSYSTADDVMFQDLSSFHGASSAWLGRGTELVQQIDLVDLIPMEE